MHLKIISAIILTVFLIALRDTFAAEACHEKVESIKFDDRDWANVHEDKESPEGILNSIFMPVEGPVSSKNKIPEQFVYKAVSIGKDLTPQQYWDVYLKSLPQLGIQNAEDEILKEGANDLTTSLTFSHEGNSTIQICRFIRGECAMYSLCYSYGADMLDETKRKQWLKSLSDAKLVPK